MKSSLQKLQKFFTLEIERGFDNNAVVGGLDRMLEHWEAEARYDGLPEDLIQAVIERIRDYPRLSTKSRAETLEGLWRRIGRTEDLPSIDFQISKIEASVEREIQQNQAQSTETESAKSVVEPTTSGNDQPVPSTTKEEAVATETVVDTSDDEVSQFDQSALEAPISILPGVGPRHAQNLERLGINVIRDMLFYFPRRYDDYSKLKPINRLSYGEEVTVIGTIQSVQTRSIQGGKYQLTEAVISDGSGTLRVNWFNQPWIKNRMRKDFSIVLSGRIDQYLGRLLLNNPEWEQLEQEHLNTNRIVPVYPLTARITQRWFRRLINQVVSYWSSRITDPIPPEIRNSVGLVEISKALTQIHFPDTWEDLGKARQRLAFDELFLLQLGVLKQKYTWHARNAYVVKTSDEWIKQQLDSLPFSLTDAQHRAVDDIRQDLASGHPMNRLLQGDVGSGKTVVAALAICAVITAGCQAVVMAPTSILAEQHYTNLYKILRGFFTQSGTTPTLSVDREIRLILGSTPESEKQEIRTGLSNGSIKLIIGTHALLEDPVKFENLQLAVIDEQHRFGVEQRAILRSKGTNPHLLVMTATPIPRSLALTVYGDLDISVIDELPPGRQEVSTYVLNPVERERAYALIRKEIRQGHQAFIIYPLVEEIGDHPAKAAVEEHVRLAEEVFNEYRIGLLHGRLKPDEKDAIMTDFRDEKFDILVSTSVIEVGIDVPNASVMLIEGANRFGLAQLHQLRGRVGRGSDKSYCILIPETSAAIENERLRVMSQTNDGFILAEHDLQQRGPGQFLGTRQSGFSDLKIANLSDIHLISKAQHSAQELFRQDPNLSKPEHQLLAESLQRSWGGVKGDIS